MKELVGLRKRPSRDKLTFCYMLDFVALDGKRKRLSLGHGDFKKAEKAKLHKEQELRMGIVAPQSMSLTNFLKDSLELTGKQIRESTRSEYEAAMKDFIKVIGNMDFKKVGHREGERFVQACLDAKNKKGEPKNSPSTVVKKLKEIKRIFQLAVERGQLDQNPLRFVKSPKAPKRKPKIFSIAECSRLIKAADQHESPLKWSLLIQMALCTGLRRGELLNLTWRDIDFEAKTVDVSPKLETDEVWHWDIKDNERRTLALTEGMVTLLTEQQAIHPEGYPYIFVPAARYDHIQRLRTSQKWGTRKGRCPVNNFTREFAAIMKVAKIEDHEFHDLRRTALSNWLTNGMSEYDVMTLAGHSEFETTHRFYLVVKDDLLSRARTASCQSFANIFGTQLARANKNEDCAKNEMP